MRKIELYILFVLCALLTGCEWLEKPIDMLQKDIQLYARMGVHLSVSDATKGEGIITSSSTNELGISAVKVENTTYFKNCSTVITASLKAPEPENSYLRQVTDFAPSQFYNSGNDISYAAWYPQGGDYNTGDDCSYVILPVTGDSDIMYASTNGNRENGFDVMEFKHALSLFKFYVYSSTKDVEWGKITNLSLKGIPDQCKLTLPYDESSKDFIINPLYSDESKKTAVVEIFNNPEGIVIEEGFNNMDLVTEWIAAATLPSGSQTLNQLQINLVTNNEGEEITSEVTIAKDFRPGYAYDIILRFSDNGVISADAVIADWSIYGTDIESEISSSEIYYNLSSNGNANCYVVSSANFAYCFDANIKGNGNTVALGGGIDVGLNPAFVNIVWKDASLEDTFVLADTNVIDNRVLFKVNGDDDKSDKGLVHEGNVLLGVYNSWDGNGKPNWLWTWHIWITDKPQKQNYTKGYVVLDRNLGATAASSANTEDSKGLFYQWGRPTPFRIKDDPTSTQTPKRKIVDATNSYTRVIPDSAVAHPEIFYGRFHSNTAGAEEVTYNPDGSKVVHINATGAADFHDWVSRKDFKPVNNLWGYREVEHVQPVKTIYDPCPAGYHVPYSRNWENMENYWTNKPTQSKPWENLGGVEFRITGEGTVVWYPFQGFINKDGVYSPGHFHRDISGGSVSYEYNDDVPIIEVWSSLINRHDNEEISGQDEKVNDSPYRFMFTKDYGAMLSDDYSNRTRGLAVRCVSDNTVDVVKDLSASQTANCYMVHEAGYYKFNATVRGNGVGSLLPLGGTTTAEINGGLSTSISPARVDILWWQGDFIDGGTDDFPQDEDEFSRNTPPENMKLTLLDNGRIGSDGYVSFFVDDYKEGNVILAAYDMLEGGNILWTWHIWMTDKPEDKLSGNYTKQDRFLGATFAPSFAGNSSLNPLSLTAEQQQASWGFYYQWGRKDPIIGPSVVNVSDVPEGSVAASGWWKKEGDQWNYYRSIPVSASASVPDVVRNPTAFYKSTTASGYPSSQWFPESFADGYTNVAMWGYAVADYSLEGQAFSKTMHDPCPPGYRTPFHFSWRYNSTYKYAEGDLGEATTTLGNEKQLVSDGTRGIVTYKADANKTYFEKMWFPFVGYRNPTSGEYDQVGTHGYMNTGMPMGQYNTRTFWYNGNYTGQHAGGYGSAYGMMVRCMKE